MTILRRTKCPNSKLHNSKSLTPAMNEMESDR